MTSLILVAVGVIAFTFLCISLYGELVEWINGRKSPPTEPSGPDDNVWPPPPKS